MKVVIGKPATRADVVNTGYVSPQDFGNWIKRYKQEKGHDVSIMFWQYLNDANGKIATTVLDTASQLEKL